MTSVPHVGSGCSNPSLLFPLRPLPNVVRAAAVSRKDGSKVPVMARNLPIKQNILHLWSLPNVMNQHVSPRLRASLVHNNSNVRNVSSQIPRHQISGRIVVHFVADPQSLAFALKA